MNNLRPQTFKDFVGQDKIKKNLKIFIKAAQNRKENLDHILMYGNAGMGKTSLAQIISLKMDFELKIIQGPHLQKIPDLMSLLTSIKKGSYIFIDEIHSISKEVQEVLYSVLEDFSVDISIGKEMNTKIVRVKVPYFTLIGATTKVGKLEDSFLDRFGIIFNFQQYEISQISKIVQKTFKKYGIKSDEKESEIIASYSRFNPRIANKLSKRIVDYAESKELKSLNAQFLRKTLSSLGYYKYGLQDDDLRYLQILKEYKHPIGVENISIIMNLPKVTIQEKIEQFLISLKFIKRSKSGRKITEEGLEYLKNTCNF